MPKDASDIHNLKISYINLFIWTDKFGLMIALSLWTLTYEPEFCACVGV